MSINKVVRTAAPWLTTKCTRAELQNFARLVGAPVSGTKSELLKSLQNTTDDVEKQLGIIADGSSRSTQKKSLSVVSIDMGIRNLAFAHLTSDIAMSGEDQNTLTISKPVLQKWTRISVGRDSLGTSKVIGTEASSSETTTEEDEIRKVEKESFEPIDLARHAYECVEYYTKLQPTPTHLLIERQRFRSGGHASVLEWSLRVGVFEGMLYSILQTLLRQGHFKGTVQPILPAQVNRFWLQGNETHRKALLDEDIETKVEKLTGKEAKRAKIELVAQILHETDPDKSQISISHDAQETVDAFLGPSERDKKLSRTKPLTARLKKLDDLADSLLQGLAWIKWQENRLRFTKQTG